MNRAQRLDIGKKIYNHYYTIAEAAQLYNVNYYTARNYLREYKAYLKYIKGELHK